MPPAEAAALAREHGMDQVGVRPPFGRYLRDLWRHRSFLITMSAADYNSRHQQNVLGQIWGLLNPIMIGAAYFLIFGLLLETNRGLEPGTYPTFLMIGLFSFIFISSGMNAGSKAITGNMGMVRALRFPRVILPISISITELFATLPAYAMALIVALLSGETPTATWLLYPVGIVITFMVTTGIGMLFARLVYAVRDASNLVPLLTRVLRYVSGVFFVITAYSEGFVQFALNYQPVAVCLTILRQAVMEQFAVDWTMWLAAAGWGIVLMVAGVVVFWQGEATYGHK
ncbi:ABC transporter permease [Ornithinimicrobium sp. Arc0846-15]|nr:ABC transporter permease [Ornithinimicrobium laminariae]